MHSTRLFEVITTNRSKKIDKVFSQENHLELIDVPDANGVTPLLYAVRLNKQHAVLYLLKKGSKAVNTPDSFGSTPLHAVCQKGLNDYIFAWLVEYGATTFGCRDINGCTPLHYAAKSGALQMARAILRHHPDAYTLEDAYGRLPLHFAASKSNLSLFCLLEEIDESNLKALDAHGLTPLHIAVRNLSVEIVYFIVVVKKNNSSLFRDSSGMTPCDYTMIDVDDTEEATRLKNSIRTYFQL
jgi:ankyrin repeat protein